MLTVYNTLTKRKEVFKPIDPARVRMYVCGMTVYDYCHVGHARVMVVFDMVARYLRASGYALTYVRNITDIDDKIIKRAAENNESIHELTARFIKAMHEDTAALGVLPVDVEPKATESIADIVALIQGLLDKGIAYVGENGDVYFEVAKFTEYGKLSGKKIDELRSGARVEVNESKRDPLDFVLWKVAKPGEPAWSSPWGEGRPGWHIECSAMSSRCLGHHFDIHGGGFDLQFPHHENEIAQSEGCHGGTYVRYWMHNGFVNVNDEKMSKSLGNFFTLRDVLKVYRAEEIRYFILASHYRSPLSYSEHNLQQAKQSLTRLYTALRGLAEHQGNLLTDYCNRFNAAMNDDFNTPEAMAVLFDLATQLNKARTERDTAQIGPLAVTLKHLAGVLGLLEAQPEAFLQGAAQHSELSAQEIEALIEQRLTARQQKNWAEADRVRDELKSKGVIIEDGAQGTTWRRVG